jgi:hypothetical protein
MSAMDQLAFNIDKILGPSISNLLSQFGTAPGVVDIKNKLAGLFRVCEARLTDGLQLADIYPILSAGLADIMQIVEEVGGMTGAQKLSLVEGLFIALYRFVDKGKDGNLNRINIPWVPDSVEGFIEDRLLPVMVRFAVEAVVAGWNKNKK